MNARKIDIYNHVMPRAVADLMLELAPSVSGMVKRVTSIPMLHDMEARVRMMEMWPGYQQVLTISNPPLEAIAGPGDTPRLARLANDELKRICDTRPDKFPAWVASLPLNNVEATLDEMDRAMAQGARGFQIFTNVNGIPLDDPSLELRNLTHPPPPNSAPYRTSPQPGSPRLGRDFRPTPYLKPFDGCRLLWQDAQTARRLAGSSLPPSLRSTM